MHLKVTTGNAVRDEATTTPWHAVATHVQDVFLPTNDSRAHSDAKDSSHPHDEAP
jgi:hypothetical protein